MLKTYSVEYQLDVGPQTWVVDLFLDLHVPYEAVFSVLEGMLYFDEAPFTGNGRRFIANDIVYLIRRWYEHGRRSGRWFGSEAMAAAITQLLGVLTKAQYLNKTEREDAQTMLQRINIALR
jgi:nuclear pore complex protein Nup155